MSEPFQAPSTSRPHRTTQTAAASENRAPTGPEIAREGAAQRTAALLAAGAESAEPIAIPRGGSFTGLLSFSGEACVLGELHGSIRATGRLRIGRDARVDARIEVDEVLIEGLVRGDVVARSKVELAASAVVEGAIHAPRIELHDGCRFTGRCQSGDFAETLDLPA
jgi:cytoskeletal protein CcmA (bactofilin family)